jgi:hypothetical protein
VAALAAAAITATPVQAQTIYGAPPSAVEPMVQPGLPPAEVLMIVRTSGLRPLTQPARRGPNWVVLASDNMGGQLNVVISAQSGRIVHASPAHDPRFAYAPMRPRGMVPVAPPEHAAAMPPSGYSAPPPDLRTPTAPPPPRTARAAPPPHTPPAAAPSQNSSLASVPDTTGSVPTRPARTPLPRPRPAIAANETSAPAAPAAPAPARPTETSPEADVPAAAPPAPAAPAKPAPTETQMVPVAPLD